jgi:predicted nucleic acid-binding protein
MLLYLDICALKRPFDDQNTERVRDESLAVLRILDRIELGSDGMVWSAALTFENDADPDHEIRARVTGLAILACTFSRMNPEAQARIESLCSSGVRTLDAAHLAFAEAAGADCLLTTDDRFIRRARRVGTTVRVLNPLEYVEQVAGHESTE